MRRNICGKETKKKIIFIYNLFKNIDDEVGPTIGIKKIGYKC